MKLHELAHKCEALAGADLNRYTDAQLESRLRELLVAQVLCFGRDSRHVWYRGVVCDSPDGFDNLRRCLYREAPPDYGRAHRPGHATLYASWNVNTVLSELRVTPNQYVQITSVRVRGGIELPCHVIGEVAHVLNSGGSRYSSHLADIIVRIYETEPPDNVTRRLLVDSFLASQFACPDNSRYRLTATYAAIASRHPGAVMFPSVQLNSAVNLSVPAIEFDRSFEVLHTQVIHVRESLGYGIYNFEAKGFSCDFDADGKINWGSAKMFPSKVSIRGGLSVPPEVQGWRVPPKPGAPNDAVVLQPASEFAQRAVDRQHTAPALQKAELTAQEWFERGASAVDTDERLRCFNESILLKPDHPYTYYNRGFAREDKRDLDGALQDYNEAIRLKPDYADAYNTRGNVRKDKGDLDGALQDYSETIRLSPDYAVAYFNRSHVRKEMGDLEGALRDSDEFVRLAPYDAHPYFNRGVARHVMGDLDGALEDYDEAIRLQPDHGYPYFNRGVVRNVKGDLDGALQDYGEAIRLQPSRADAYFYRGNVRRDKGDLDGALQDYDEAIRLQPDYADVYFYRGNVRMDKGDPDGALQEFNEAIRLDPNHADAYNNRGLLRKDKGDLDGARQDWDEAARLDKSREDVRAADGFRSGGSNGRSQA